jgi:hypothetical protein
MNNISKGAVTLSSVEGLSAEACPPYFDGLSMTPFLELSFYGPLPQEGNLNSIILHVYK